MVYINDDEKIKNLANNMNTDNVYIFMDFDKTITIKQCVDSWDASANSEILGDELSSELTRYYKKYRPIEVDYKLEQNEKEKYMIEWYRTCMELYYKHNMTKEKLEQSINKSKIILRKGLKNFFLKLYEKNIPVIILSAGIGNGIEQTLRNEGCYYENIKIISNFIKFDKNGNMIEYSDYLIHTLNKNIDKLADLKIKSSIEEKKYRIAIGDLIEDIQMIGQYEDEKSLKIGFLNENIEQNMDMYKSKFDIVLTEENSFFDIEKLLGEIINY